jgi:hypothetical protein
MTKYDNYFIISIINSIYILMKYVVKLSINQLNDLIIINYLDFINRCNVILLHIKYRLVIYIKLANDLRDEAFISELLLQKLNI